MEDKQSHTGKRTIIMLTWEYPPSLIGGLSRHVHGLSMELAKIGLNVHVITANPFDTPRYEKKEGVHIHRVTPLNDKDPNFMAWIGGLNLAIVNEAISIARVSEVNIVHTHDWLTGPAALYINKVLKVPLVATIHATEYGRNKGIFTKLQQSIALKEKELSNSADRVIVCSDFMAEEVSSLFDVQKDKLKVIPNGSLVDVNKQPDLILERSFPFLTGKKIIFSIGRIVREKGFDSMIRAAAILKESHPEICFVIAGNGPLLDKYRQTARELSLDDFIYFIGFISEQQRITFLKKCDMAIFPSLYEPFGLAAAESLAHGVPTIVSDTGGLKDLVVDFETGFFMEPGSETSLAKVVAYILENEEAAKKIANEGKRVVKNQFCWEQNARLTEKVYEELLVHDSDKEVNNGDRCEIKAKT